MTATVFKNARMVLPGEVVLGSLQVDAGRIASVDGGGTSALQGIDLGGDYLLQQVDHHKQLVENYQKQIDQLSKSLDKANASIQDFAQTKLLEMKGSLSGSSISQDENNSKDNQGDSEIVSSESNSKPATNQEAINTKGKKRWWSLSL